MSCLATPTATPADQIVAGWGAALALHAADAIVVAGPGGLILFFNGAAETMFGYRAGDMVGRVVGDLVPDWAARGDVGRLWRQRGSDFDAGADGQPLTGGRVVEATGRRRNGGLFPIEMSLTHVERCGCRMLVLILRDLSVRKRAEADLHATVAALTEAADTHALLLQELRHRMRNNLQTVLSMIQLERTRPLGTEAAAELGKLESRIIALHGIDGELTAAPMDQPIALERYLRGLVNKLERLFRGAAAPVFFRLELEEVDVPPKTAACLGLLVNEAVTNSFKHAVPRGADEIVLTLSRRDGRIRLSIGDNGPGSDGADAHVGGTGLMRQLARHLCATLEREEGRAGMGWRITLPDADAA